VRRLYVSYHYSTLNTAPAIIIIIIHAASDLRCSISIKKNDFEIALAKLGKTQLLSLAAEGVKQELEIDNEQT
jgi:ribosomal protein L25 (general stress protein Ctc)